MAQSLRTIVIVVSLSLLIWFYADQASTESAAHTVWLRLRPPGSAQWRLADPNSERARVVVTFTGPTRAIAELEEEVQSDRFLLSYVIEADTPSGPYTIEQLAAKLDALEEVRRRGLSVAAVDPPDITIQVDRLITKEFPVTAQADTFKIVQTTVRPPTVKITLPESQKNKLDVVEIVANIEALEAHRNQIREHLAANEDNPGQPIELYDVPLVRPPGLTLKLEPEWVAVTAVIERRDQTKLLRGVYVRFDVSLDQWRKYDLEVRDSAALSLEVNVRGPSDLIASLTPQDVRAYVEIKTGDAIRTEGWLTRSVNFDLPPGVILDQSSPQVQFRLMEKGKPTAG